MLDRFYVARDGKTFGPFSTVQLRGLAAGGRLRTTDSLWRDGAIDRPVLAGKVKNLFPAAAPKAPAIVPSEASPAAAEAPGEAGEAHVEADPTHESPAPPPVAPSPDAVSPDAPHEKKPPHAAEAARKRRAIAGKGAIVLSQDGTTVHFRKKCVHCGFEDRNKSTMRIGVGMTRVGFFCTKCRKLRDVQIQGISC